MPAGDLDLFSPTKGYRFYVDTSALLPAAFLAAKATGSKIQPHEEKRGQKLARFASRAKRNQASLVTTIVALEELAAVSRGKYREMVAKQKNHASWKAFRAADPTAAMTEDKNAHPAMLKMTNHALIQMASFGIELDQIETVGGQSTVAAEALRKEWIALLQRWAIDPMDALHICVGTAIGATHFITFDTGWDSVSSIVTLR